MSVSAGLRGGAGVTGRGRVAPNPHPGDGRPARAPRDLAAFGGGGVPTGVPEAAEARGQENGTLAPRRGAYLRPDCA